MKVLPLTCALGAELQNVSLAEASRNDDLASEIKGLLLQHKVLFARDQVMTDVEHAAFARKFGELEDHPLTSSVDGEPGIIHIYKTPENPPERYENAWHNDATWRECPPMGAVLRCVECPPVGGDTMWANMELAYERLPDHVKETIADLRARHSMEATFMAARTVEERLAMKERFPDPEHPVVRTHPVTGSKSLFTSAFITHFTNFHTAARVRVGQDWHPGASNLLQYLVSQSFIPEYQVRWRWSPNAVAIWDNRCTQHYAVMDYPPCHRKMHRATIIGDRPFSRTTMDRALNLDLSHDYADLGDVRLHYVCGGKGPAIVFLHGWPQTWYMWRDVLPGLMQSYRVIAADLRGLGESTRPDGGYDTKTVAQDIWRLMHDVLGEKHFYVVGHDWGGPVAYALAAQHRDAVLGMAIFDAPVPGDGSVLTSLPRWHFGFHAEADLPEALVAGREELYLRHMYRKGGARPDAVSEDAQCEYVRTYAKPGAMRAGFNYYRAMAQDAKDNLGFAKQGKLKMPILVYGGGAANVGRGLFAMDSWQRVAADVRGGVAEGCGHWIPEERPAWVVERLLEFFGAIDHALKPPLPALPSVRSNTFAKGNLMYYESIDTALIDVESLPWMPFTPYSDEIFLKLIKVDPIRGEWVTLLKIPPRFELPMHHHSGTVMVWTIAGKWKYLEHDWIGTPGSFVFETAGSRHTPVSVSDDDVITLNIVQGDWNIVTPEGAVLAIENWKSMMDRYLNFCKARGIDPLDISSFSR